MRFLEHYIEVPQEVERSSPYDIVKVRLNERDSAIAGLKREVSNRGLRWEEGRLSSSDLGRKPCSRNGSIYLAFVELLRYELPYS